MTIENAFIFSWDCYGIEAIIPITEYQHHENNKLIKLLSDRKATPNPLNAIIFSLKMRAHANPQRNYEIYAVSCDTEMTYDFWLDQWSQYPQLTADIVRANGVKIYCNRDKDKRVIR